VNAKKNLEKTHEAKALLAKGSSFLTLLFLFFVFFFFFSPYERMKVDGGDESAMRDAIIA